jgi:hypothetical protein
VSNHRDLRKLFLAISRRNACLLHITPNFSSAATED